MRVALEVPGRTPLRSLSLRLRLPRGDRITGTTVDGRPAVRLTDPETIELPRRPGQVEIVARISRR